MSFFTTIEQIHNKLLSSKTKQKSEQVILIIAIASFFIHLFIIFLVDYGIISNNANSDLLSNPIAAIYTPFSFILIYEVYLLVYYLPKSISIYIGKQYEIIMLIIIRRLFKDLSSLSLSLDWFKIKNDLQFTYDIVVSLIIFYLIYLFYKQSKKNYNNMLNVNLETATIKKFIQIKKVLAVFLVPVLIFMSIYAFVKWSIGTINPSFADTVSFKNINNIFFEQFFTILIIADVLLLLFSFFHTDEFHKVIRNSGFIISTILIRISFSTSGLLNNLLILSAILFGLLILMIHNKFEAQNALENAETRTPNIG